MSVKMLLRSATDGTDLAGPLPARLNDISFHGAGLSAPDIRIGEYHFFYAPQENTALLLVLEVTLSRDRILTLPVNPVRLDRDLTGASNPFRLGVEFQAGPGDEQVKLLVEAVIEMQGPRRGFWRDLIRKFLPGYDI